MLGHCLLFSLHDTYTDGAENKDEQYCWCLNLNQGGDTQLYCQSLGSSPPYTCAIKECP